ncbi:MAG: cobalamin biosynthesis protein, partial [Methanothrix sp.]|nr:cobalamin biosynthesis protein [Methanothrix sp.]
KAADTLRTAFRYHAATPSPNSGWPMSAFAGALGIRLEKPGFYTLNEDGTQPQTSDIPKAIGLMKAVIGLTLAAALALLIL